MAEQNFTAMNAPEGSELPTILAFALYQDPEEDESLTDEAFLRKCPNCGILFDVRTISEHLRIAFLGRKGGVRAFPCPECVESMSKLDSLEFRNSGEKALKNIEDSANPNDWAVTTNLAVWSHGGDEVAAIVYGCLLSDRTIDAYDQGEIEISLTVLGIQGGGNARINF